MVYGMNENTKKKKLVTFPSVEGYHAQPYDDDPYSVNRQNIAKIKGNAILPSDSLKSLMEGMSDQQLETGAYDEQKWSRFNQSKTAKRNTLIQNINSN